VLWLLITSPNLHALGKSWVCEWATPMKIIRPKSPPFWT
jgi:hypothetical protein